MCTPSRTKDSRRRDQGIPAKGRNQSCQANLGPRGSQGREEEGSAWEGEDGS